MLIQNKLIQSEKIKKKIAKRRQWGAENRTIPLPMIHERPSDSKIVWSRIAILLTILFYIAYFISTIIREFFLVHSNFQFTMQAISYLIIVTFLTFSALIYLVARQGALQRFAKHIRVPRAKLDDYFYSKQPTITVLVPSYSEEPQVVRKTLMSAALQEYPNMRVVLLIDDNPNPTNPTVAERLNKTRNLANDIMELFSEPRIRFKNALSQFGRHNTKNKFASSSDVKKLISNYIWASEWLNSLADNEVIEDHVDVFFSEQVLRGLAKDLRIVADALNSSCLEGAKLSVKRVNQLYLRLNWIFNTELAVFERKKYASLSHEANKAMNLNSYIGLMGGSYKIRNTPEGIVLVPTVNAQKSKDLIVPDSDYLLTLDADSILLREYCLRLVYFLEQPDNARVAVTQTPYSSFRGAGTRIERLAGATTDIQHILHQGMSYYGATFWVGANAVIRKVALEDIAETEYIGGFKISRYIQDRTVIEDTESSVDLALHGWTLVNYPERLSYSATPPDFGSLVIQRRRWANGGLLILPKLWAHIKDKKRKNEPISQMAILLRVNYMASIAWSSVGLIFLLAYPYDGRLLSPLVLLAALPYFIAMGNDLKYCGYKWTDVFRIYGFNLILLPVNLAGVLKSLQQALNGKKIPFARTPKIKDRTGVQATYVIIPLLIVAFSIFTVWRNVAVPVPNWGNAIFAAFNAFSASWAIIAYIGIWNSIVDIWIGMTSWLYVETKKDNSKKIEEKKSDVDWRSVLYYGDMKGTINPSSSVVIAASSINSKKSVTV